MRDTTERPEAVYAGTVALVGVNEEEIIRMGSMLLDDRDRYQAMSRAVNPYGDGAAAGRRVAAIERLLGVGEELPEFAPQALEQAGR